MSTPKTAATGHLVSRDLPDFEALDLSLRPAPSIQWHDREQELLLDKWLARKVDRNRRVGEHLRYVLRHCPQIRTVEPGLVIDVGPGPGELLEIARALGHEHQGIDAPDGVGGMGDKYVEYSRMMHQRQGLAVDYKGFLAWLEDPPIGNRAVLINLRGSIEQSLCDFMTGDPHHEHQDCKQLEWEFGERLVATVDKMCSVFRSLLRDDGCVLIHCNGSASVGERLFDALLDHTAARAGFAVAVGEPRFHKWTV